MNDKYVTIKPNKKDIGFIIQLVMVVIMIIIGGISLFIKDVKPYFYLALSLNMVVLVVNNFLFMKKKYFWIVYVAFAIYLFILFLQGVM